MVFIERKSPKDLWSSVASNKNFERFCREIERAQAENKYIIVLVESELRPFLGINYYTGAIAGFVIVLAYIFTGGFVAVVWSDFGSWHCYIRSNTKIRVLVTSSLAISK